MERPLRLLMLVVLWTAGHSAAGPELVSIPSLDGKEPARLRRVRGGAYLLD